MSHGNTLGDGSGEPLWFLLDLLGRLRINDDWEPHLEADTDADDSDKEFTVDADYHWIIQSVYVKFTTVGGGGNRLIVIEIQDASNNVVAIFYAGIVQAASLTRYYQFAPHLPNLTAFVQTDQLTNPIQDLMLDEAYGIRVYDINAVDATHDDMEVQLLVKRRPKES